MRKRPSSKSRSVVYAIVYALPNALVPRISLRVPSPNSRPVNGWEVSFEMVQFAPPPLPLVHDACIKVNNRGLYADLWFVGHMFHGFSYQLAGDE